MTYDATLTVQITTAGGENPAPRIHEMRPDGSGRPVCGTPLREYRGLPCIYTQQGAGKVTCLRCGATK